MLLRERQRHQHLKVVLKYTVSRGQEKGRHYLGLLNHLTESDVCLYTPPTLGFSAF